jgi:two-component system response regulator MprA
MPTILIAEDHAESRRPLARLLRHEGYQVLVAADANEAVAQANRGAPDLILLDVAMPPIDGLTFLAQFRASPDGRDIPVILITGLSDSQTRQRAQDLGVKAYLVKSEFTMEQLLELIRQNLVPQKN